MTARSELLHGLQKARSYANEKYFSRSEDELKKISKSILNSKFYPLICEYYSIKTLIDENQNNLNHLFLDYLLSLSPYFGNSESSEIEVKIKNLIQLSQNNNEKYILNINQNIVYLLPFSINIKYLKSSIISGQKFGFSMILENHFSSPFIIDQIQITFIHDDSQKVISTFNEITLSPNEIQKIQQYEAIPNAVRTQAIESVSLQVGNYLIIYKPPISEHLIINPDVSSCKLEIIMPTRCLICVNLPVQLKIIAENSDLENVTLSFQDPAEFPPTHAGNTGPYNIKKGETKLCPFIFHSSAPVFTVVTLTLSFSTKVSGFTSIQKDMVFDFTAPFNIFLKIVDSNCKEIRSSTLYNYLSYSLETTFVNVLKTSLKINRICLQRSEPGNDNQISENNDIDKEYLPIILHDGEQYTFTTPHKVGHQTLLIDFICDNVQIHYFFNIHPFSIMHSPCNFSFESPSKARVYEKFTCKLIVDRRNSTTPECLPLKINIENKKMFIFTGLQSGIHLAWPGNVSIIQLDIIPVEAGSFLLPKISIDDDSGTPHIFESPIVVYFNFNE